MELCEFFDRVVVINLRRRPDRLATFEAGLEEARWPFQWPDVIEAIDGNVVPCPPEFTQGGGAFGCRQSHVAILQQALMDGVGSLLVLEDDAQPLPGFVENVARFLRDVPQDWEGLMLGGQHHAAPTPVKPGVVRVKYAQRTHAYACRGEYMRGLVQRWANATVHIDWLMRDWQHRHRVYAPDRFLIGQARSKSDINGRLNAAQSWNDPTGEEPVIHLNAPRAVAEELRQWGLHYGYDRDAATGIDVGLRAVFANTDPNARLSRLADWIRTIQGEAVSEPGLVCCVWHPECPPDMVRQATRANVHTIQADTIDAALRQLPPTLKLGRRPSRANRFVVLLRAPRAVMNELRGFGFHGGYWRNADDIDHGLADIFAQPEGDGRTRRLADWINTLRPEAEAIHNGVVTVWHPKATAGELRKATDLDVVEIVADTAADAMRQMEGTR